MGGCRAAVPRLHDVITEDIIAHQVCMCHVHVILAESHGTCPELCTLVVVVGLFNRAACGHACLLPLLSNTRKPTYACKVQFGAMKADPQCHGLPITGQPGQPG